MRLTHFAVLLILSAIQVMPAFLSAQPQLSGPQSGVLGPGSYLVVGDIIVEEGAALQILSGTEFQHNGPYCWNIYGQLSAEGAEADSIYFIPIDTLQEHRWGGLRFQGNPEVSNSIDYCVIEYCRNEDYMVYQFGAGISIDSARVSISNSRISHCYAINGGSGIFVIYGIQTKIDRCAITNNSSYYDYHGSGIFIWNCEEAEVKNSVIAYNYALTYC